MIEIQSIADIELLRESVDLECKLAGGRDGRGAVPDDFWPTYSAFANAQGGMVLLGVREKNGQLEAVGIHNVALVRKELFDGLNSRQKVSVNLLADASVCEIVLEGKTILAVEVPRATRKQRPVYLTTNPLSGHTYRRLNDGDRALPDEEVKRMLAEQVNDSRDDRILKGYDVEDLDAETLRAYRQVFTNRDPGHVWNALGDREFLRQIGGWRKDRETGDGVSGPGDGWAGSTIRRALRRALVCRARGPGAGCFGRNRQSCPAEGGDHRASGGLVAHPSASHPGRAARVYPGARGCLPPARRGDPDAGRHLRNRYYNCGSELVEFGR